MSDVVGMEGAIKGYDIIGDVHGCAESLVELLETLGYVKRDGAYEYRDQARPRIAVFVGDLIDRGQTIRESVLIARDMVDRGSALVVMGNHEYHALAYCTEARPGSEQKYLREHTERHTKLIVETLEQFASYPNDWRDTLAWIAELPLLMEFPSFRVIHACWDQQMIDPFLERCPGAVMTEEFLHESGEWGSFASRCVDRLTRGPGMRLPGDMVMTSKEGFLRRSFRIKFWAKQPETYGDLQFQPDPLPIEAAEYPISDEQREKLVHYDRHQRPLFFGHYWHRGIPKPVAPNLACLDYSAVGGGQLVAYRMDGESVLDANKFVAVRGSH